MIKRTTSIFILICALFASACIDEIDFDVPREYQNSTVIVGKIVKGNPSSVEVFIQKIFDFSFEDDVYVNAQSVRIVNESGDKIEVPLTGLGLYTIDLDGSTGFDVEIGDAFSLEVDLFDGQRFKSSLETIIPVPKMEKLESKLIQKEIINFQNETVIRPRVTYAVSSPLVAEQNQQATNIKWDFEFTYKFTDNTNKSCYVSGFPDFDLIQLVDAKTIGLPSIEDYQVLEQNVTNLLTEGQYISVIQEALSDDAFKFWEQTRELSTNSGTFYEPPPGQVITNFEATSDTEGAVFGYFYGTQHDTLRVFVDSTFVNQNPTICPSPPSQDPNPPCDQCCDCENAANSTTDKPSFWIN